MALVMADLSESQRETLINLTFQRGVELTALTVDHLREFLITLFHAPKSSLENPNWAHKSGPRSLVMRASVMSMGTSSGSMTKSSATG